MVKGSRLSVCVALALWAIGPAQAAADPGTAAPDLLGPRLDVGLRTTAVGLSLGHGQSLHQEGLGVQVRGRLDASWRVGVTVESVRTPSNAYSERSSLITTVGLAYLFNPWSPWSWSALVGVGRASTTMKSDGSEYRDWLARFGVALERRFSTTLLGAEVVGVAMTREDDGNYSYGSVRPMVGGNESSILPRGGQRGSIETYGAQLSLYFAYTF